MVFKGLKGLKGRKRGKGRRGRRDGRGKEKRMMIYHHPNPEGVAYQ